MPTARAALLLLALSPLATAQFYTFSTFAGSGRPVFSGGGPAVSAKLIQPTGVAADADGNFFVADSYYHQVLRVAADGTISVYAGTGGAGYSGDGGPALAARLFNPNELAVDSAGNLYICDFSNSRVRKVTPAGIITTVAGSGQEGASGDGGPATSAAVGGPFGVAIDSSGNLFITESNLQVIRKVNTAGIISTIAGNGNSGFSGDAGPATAAMLSHPQGIRVDSSGNVYFADNYNHRVRKIAADGTITTFAGNGNLAFQGDGGRANAAALFYPTDVALGANGNIYIADATNTRIRLVNSSGFISTFAGGGLSTADGSALQATLSVPTALAFDKDGNLLVTLAYLRQIRSITPAQTIKTVAGALLSPAVGDGGPATSAVLLDPFGIALDNGGNVFVADQFDNRIRRIDPTGVITTAAGNGIFGSTGNGGPATSAQLGSPRALTADPQGNIYVTSPIGALVRKVSNGSISTFAGNGQVAGTGDGGRATQASLNVPIGLGSDAQGNIYISDAGEARIRRVDTASIITSIAGTGVEGFSGDNGAASLARIYQPRQIAADRNGNIYFADNLNHRVRKIVPGGVITTVAGNGTQGFAGDGGPATAAQVGLPTGVAFDDAGNLYIAGSQRVRKVNASTGIISTIAGGAIGSTNQDGILATSATFSQALHLAIDSTGALYVTDTESQRVRKLTPVQIVREGVANGATLVAGGVAPGEIVTIYTGPGVALGPAAGAGLTINEFGRVSNLIAGVQVLFDGLPAPLTFVNAGQVNAIVPYGVAGKTTTQLQLRIQGRPTNTITVNVVESSPGVFAITNSNGGVNSASNPTTDRVLVIYATGEGKTTPAVADGAVNNTVFPKPLLPVSVLVGGQEAAIAYVGAAPNFVAGVLQLNIQIPAGITGTVPLQIKIGEATTPPGLTISVR